MSRSIRRAADPRTRETRLIGAATASVLVSIVLAATAWRTDTALGAPLYWPWLLTGLQVLALWSAGTKRWWGWLLGAAVQPPWIAYALMTSQLGFVPGCAISAVVQTCSYLRGRSDAPTPVAAPRLSDAGWLYPPHPARVASGR